MSKLQQLIGSGLNYLTNRRQVCYVKGVKSAMNVICGVSQGSILGPLLFLIDVNDTSKTDHAVTRLFADDTNLTFSGSVVSPFCKIR